jgi:hypothetical protein
MRGAPEDERRAVVLALFAWLSELADARGAMLLFVLSPTTSDFNGSITGELRLFRELLDGSGRDTLDFRKYLEEKKVQPQGLHRDPCTIPPGTPSAGEAIFERLRPALP